MNQESIDRDTAMFAHADQDAKGAPWLARMGSDKRYAAQAKMTDLCQDLKHAARFFDQGRHRSQFPALTYIPVQIRHIIDAGGGNYAEGAQDWAILSARVLDYGGDLSRGREHVDADGVRKVLHKATMPLGSGRVVYEVLWIERLEEDNDNA